MKLPRPVYLQRWWGRQPFWKTNVENERRILRSLRKTENQRVAVDLLNATPHAEVGVNADFQVMHRH